MSEVVVFLAGVTVGGAGTTWALSLTALLRRQETRK